MTIAYNMDCMEYMRSLPDKAFDIAVVDPPYGDGQANARGGVQPLRRVVQPLQERPDCASTAGTDGTDTCQRVPPRQSCTSAEAGAIGISPPRVERTGGTWAEKFGKKIVAWDVAPDKEYFDELFRVSRNQIIWGGNYFGLPPTRCFLVLRKKNIPENFSMAMCEYAWTSFNANAKVFECNMNGQPGRFHPSQKTVELYEWIYTRFCKEGDKILDTHLGSGSSRIAAYNLGFDFVGCEIDKEYFDKQEERFAAHTAQTSLFV